ncbi:unnamed protein product [Scytosiphon promiscuus]
MPVKIDINVSSLRSSLVEGDVVLNIATTEAEGYSAYSLKLRLVGQLKTKVRHSTGTGTDRKTSTASQKKEIFGHDMELASFGGRLAPGVLTFPFSCEIPPGLPPSMEESGNKGTCSIAYKLKARLHRNRAARIGLFSKMTDPKSTRPLILHGTTSSGARSAAPVLMGPETRTVRNCCAAAGIVTIGSRVDSLAVGKGETVGLNVAATNNSTSTVTAMHIKIQQLATWSARGYHDRKKRTLAAIVVGGPSLGALQLPVEAGTARGQGLASVAETARENLRRQLIAGGGTRYELSVPRNALPTVRTDTIEVKHFLVLKLKTTGACSASDISAALQVRGPSASAASAQPVTR